MTISHVTSWSTAGATSLGVAPSAVGDALVLAVSTTSAPSGILVSGGGAATWVAGPSWLDTGVNCYVGLFLGVVTAAGAATVSVSGIGAGGTGLWAGQFNESTPGATWSVSSASNAPGSSGPATGSGTNITYPSLSAAVSGDSLYVGVCFSIFGSMVAGSTPGYTYEVNGTTARQVAYDPTFSGTGSPVATQTNTGTYDAVAAIIAATASGGTAHTRTGSLTVTPSFAADRVRGKYRTGSLSVSPSFSASRARGHFRTGSLPVSPSFSASRTHGHARTGSLLVTPSFSATRRAAHVRTGSLLVVPQFLAVPSGGAAPSAQKGSWWGLHSVFQESRQEYDAYWARPPLDCPRCAEPLINAPSAKSGTGVELFCRYDGWQFPRDREQPTRMDAGSLGGDGW